MVAEESCPGGCIALLKEGQVPTGAIASESAAAFISRANSWSETALAVLLHLSVLLDKGRCHVEWLQCLLAWVKFCGFTEMGGGALVSHPVFTRAMDLLARRQVAELAGEVISELACRHDDLFPAFLPRALHWSNELGAAVTCRDWARAGVLVRVLADVAQSSLAHLAQGAEPSLQLCAGLLECLKLLPVTEDDLALPMLAFWVAFAEHLLHAGHRTDETGTRVGGAEDHTGAPMQASGAGGIFPAASWQLQMSVAVTDVLLDKLQLPVEAGGDEGIEVGPGNGGGDGVEEDEGTEEELASVTTFRLHAEELLCHLSHLLGLRPFAAHLMAGAERAYNEWQARLGDIQGGGGGEEGWSGCRRLEACLYAMTAVAGDMEEARAADVALPFVTLVGMLDVSEATVARVQIGPHGRHHAMLMHLLHGAAGSLLAAYAGLLASVPSRLLLQLLSLAAAGLSHPLSAEGCTAALRRICELAPAKVAEERGAVEGLAQLVVGLGSLRHLSPLQQEHAVCALCSVLLALPPVAPPVTPTGPLPSPGSQGGGHSLSQTAVLELLVPPLVACLGPLMSPSLPGAAGVGGVMGHGLPPPSSGTAAGAGRGGSLRADHAGGARSEAVQALTRLALIFSHAGVAAGDGSGYPHVAQQGPTHTHPLLAAVTFAWPALCALMSPPAAGGPGPMDDPTVAAPVTSCCTAALTSLGGPLFLPFLPQYLEALVRSFQGEAGGRRHTPHASLLRSLVPLVEVYFNAGGGPDASSKDGTGDTAGGRHPPMQQGGPNEPPTAGVPGAHLLGVTSAALGNGPHLVLQACSMVLGGDLAPVTSLRTTAYCDRHPDVAQAFFFACTRVVNALPPHVLAAVPVASVIDNGLSCAPAGAHAKHKGVALGALSFLGALLMTTVTSASLADRAAMGAGAPPGVGGDPSCCHPVGSQSCGTPSGSSSAGTAQVLCSMVTDRGVGIVVGLLGALLEVSAMARVHKVSSCFAQLATLCCSATAAQVAQMRGHAELHGMPLVRTWLLQALQGSMIPQWGISAEEAMPLMQAVEMAMAASVGVRAGAGGSAAYGDGGDGGRQLKRIIRSFAERHRH
eukprot:jgi/Mesvir1/23625/Mv18301-RA.1